MKSLLLRSGIATLIALSLAACGGGGGSSAAGAATQGNSTSAGSGGSALVQPDPPPAPDPEPAPEPEPEPAPEPSEPVPEPSEPVPEPSEPAPEPSEPAPEPSEPAPVPAPTASLSAADQVVDRGRSTELRWTSTDADSCTAAGGWSGTRAPSGTASSGALNRETTFSLTCLGSGGTAVSMISVAVNGEVVLQWQPPTQNEDGSPLTDLDGYRIHFGEQSRRYTDSVDLTDPGRRRYTLTLPSGSYYLAMTAVNASGNESAFSNEVLRTVD